MSIRAIIVDDEKNARENLAFALKKHCSDVEIVGEAASVEQAIEVINNTDPNLVFLDIQMPGGNGFQLLEYFETYNFNVIFVTAFDQYAIKAIRFSAIDYLLKPINVVELKEAVQRFSRRTKFADHGLHLKQLNSNLNSPEQAKIALPTQDRIEFIPVKEIIHCKGESNYTKIHFQNRPPLLVAKTLVEFEELLSEYQFIRVHKTHLVNLNQVKAYIKNDGGYLLMENEDNIAISRRRKESVLHALSLLKMISS
ncbi:response regulator transcription factor [Puteibacter caeruleilacunae]|nr:response regulator transcription factor [Puteibacter caeruleilacunae]